VRETVPG